MIKKVLILAAAMLVTANLFCDITIENKTPNKVIAYVEDVTKIIQPGKAELFKITVKAGKTLDGIPFAPGNGMVKWVVLNEKPIVYRSEQLELPDLLIIKPDGRNYFTRCWYGTTGRKYDRDRVAEISGKTPLTEACRKNDLNTVKVELGKEGGKEWINVPDIDGNTPISIALSNRNPWIKELLFKNGAKRTDITEAIFANNITRVKELIADKSFNINAACPEVNIPPLNYACYFNRTEIVKLLLAIDGVDANKNVFSTPLIDACKNNNIEIVKLLLQKGANVNAVTVELTPLIAAINNNNIEMVKLLLEKGADVNQKALVKNDNTPLIYACRKNNIEIVKLLLQKGVDVNKANYRGHTPLHAARDNKEITKLLLEKGAITTPYKGFSPPPC